MTFFRLFFTIEIMGTSQRRGRPPKDKDRRLSVILRVMVTEAQDALIRDALRLEGSEFSEWARTILVRAAEKRIAQARKQDVGSKNP